AHPAASAPHMTAVTCTGELRRQAPQQDRDSPVMTLARSVIVGPSLGGQNVCASWRGGCMVRSLRSFRSLGSLPSLHGMWRFPVLIAVGLMVASSCSSSSSAGAGITPAATIFVQNFRYNGVPTTLSSGIVTFL